MKNCPAEFRFRVLSLRKENTSQRRGAPCVAVLGAVANLCVYFGIGVLDDGRRGAALRCGVASSAKRRAPRRSAVWRRQERILMCTTVSVAMVTGLWLGAGGGRPRWMYRGPRRWRRTGQPPPSRCRWCGRRRTSGGGGGAANLSDSVILVNSFSSRIVTNSAHGGRARLRTLSRRRPRF